MRSLTLSNNTKGKIKIKKNIENAEFQAKTKLKKKQN